MKIFIILVLLFAYIDKTDKVIDTTEIQKNNSYEINTVELILPDNWFIEQDDYSFYNFFDENNIKRGWLLRRKYDSEYGYSNIKRNHSSLINEEFIQTPIGIASLYTLDVDNGTAASGIKGTHNEYRAIIKIKDKAIYILQFSKKDKSKQTKKEFVDILESLTFK